MITLDRLSRRHLVDGSKPLYDRSFRHVERFSEGLAPVRADFGWGYIDEAGAIAIPDVFEEAHPFSDGLAPVRDGEGAFHIGLDGRPAYSARHSWVGGFSEGLALARLRDGGYAFIGRGGEPVSPVRHLWAGGFSEGLAPVLDPDGFRYVDVGGREVLGPYRRAEPFSGGVAAVADARGWFRTDRLGIPLDRERYDGVMRVQGSLWWARRGRMALLLDGARETTVSTLPPAPRPICPPLPAWVGDAEGSPCESRVILMRHAERRSISRCETGVGGEYRLLPEGFLHAEAIGEELADCGIRIDRAVSSPVPRCLETAEAVVRGNGAGVSVDTDMVLLGSGFVTETEAFGEAVCPLMTSTLSLLRGEPVKGWVPVRRGARGFLDLIRGLLDQGGTSLALTHDNFIVLVEGAVSGRWPGDSWPGFCDGAVFVRRDGRDWMVLDGRWYPMEVREGPADVSPAEAVLPDVPPSAKAGTIRGVRYSWVGETAEGLTPVRDAKGLFGYLRGDGHPIAVQRYPVALPFRDGNAPALLPGRGWCCLNDRGEYSYMRTLLSLSGYSEGIAAARDEGGWLHVDVEGDELRRGRLLYAGDFHDGEALVLTPDRGWCAESREGLLTPLGGPRRGMCQTSIREYSAWQNASEKRLSAEPFPRTSEGTWEWGRFSSAGPLWTRATRDPVPRGSTSTPPTPPTPREGRSPRSPRWTARPPRSTSRASSRRAPAAAPPSWTSSRGSA